MHRAVAKKKFLHRKWAKKKFWQAKNPPPPYHFSNGPSLIDNRFNVMTFRRERDNKQTLALGADH